MKEVRMEGRKKEGREGKKEATNESMYE